MFHKNNVTISKCMLIDTKLCIFLLKLRYPALSADLTKLFKTVLSIFSIDVTADLIDCYSRESTCLVGSLRQWPGLSRCHGRCRRCVQPVCRCMTLQGGVASRCARKRGSIAKVFKMASKEGDKELETKIMCLKLRRTCLQDFVRGNELQKRNNDVKSKTSEIYNIKAAVAISIWPSPYPKFV